jgi:uncharacterized protein (DUF488 family)
MPDFTVYTIGHSTHPLDEFLSLLKPFGIVEVVDVRTVPRSRHTPQFNEDTFPAFLHEHGIGYMHLALLGGFRHPHADSKNMGWHNTSFRGYADYMQTPSFQTGLEELLKTAKGSCTVVMCAESLPWRCHRTLIADALVIRGIPVCHILPSGTLREHVLTAWACVNDETITYPEKEACRMQASQE